MYKYKSKKIIKLYIVEEIMFQNIFLSLLHIYVYRNYSTVTIYWPAKVIENQCTAWKN